MVQFECCDVEASPQNSGVARGLAMEIHDFTDRPNHDIKNPLRKLAASPKPVPAHKGRLLLELALHLENCPGPRVVGHLMLEDLWLQAGGRGNASVRVSVDWQDYGPLDNGLPLMHYRVWLKRPNEVLSQETRTGDVDEAARAVVKALIDS